jgi:hypothetical protein
MSSLRELARGQRCYLRLPTCNYDPNTTVLAHLRIGNVAGVGQKPPDICGVPACSSCHDVLDGRTQTGLAKTEIQAETHRAHVQWLAFLWRSGAITTEVK